MRKRAITAPAVMAVTMLVLLGTANATLIELDDLKFGPGSITRDTDTGLDWLDVPLSEGRSYNDVSLQLGPGGDFEGFRYADHGEVQQLIYDAGIGETYFHADQLAAYEPALRFQHLVGETSPGDTRGATAIPHYTNQHFGIWLHRDDVALTAVLEDPFETTIDDDATGSFGHWLVRPIPEPSTDLLLVAGRLGLASWRRVRDVARFKSR
jgi:hypothetical protein